MTTPAWQAARNGLPGNLDATNASAQIGQMLGTHAGTEVYEGSLLVSTPALYDGTNGITSFYWIDSTNAPSLPGLLWYDLSQAFVMPTGKTTVGRVQLAMQPVGSGADVQVTLYPDSGGNPNLSSPLASTVVPKSWLTSLGAVDGLASGGPLATPRFNTVMMGAWNTTNWTQPAISANGAATYATPVTAGNYVILLGGDDDTTATASANVTTVRYLGAETLSGPSPQQPLPQASFYGMATATSSTIMYCGGTNGTTVFNNVWTASWDPNTGTVGSWTAQANLPTILMQAGCVSWGDYVYVIGGSTSSSGATEVASVWYASATNGRISSWLAGTPLPQALQLPMVGVVGNWLVVSGGQPGSGSTIAATYYAQINPDGSLGAWQAGPNLPSPVFDYASGWCQAVTDSALLVIGGYNTPGNATLGTQILTVTAEGVSDVWQWQAYTVPNNPIGQCVAFPNGSPGGWDVFSLGNTFYISMPFSPVPMLSVPLPASGLTAGATYHVVAHQLGGDLNNYVQVGEVVSETSQQWQYATRYGTGPWTAHTGHALVLNVFDQTSGGPMIHTWQDPSVANLAAASSTLVSDWRGRLLGVCEATLMPNNPLNSNDLTSSSVSPWTATAGTITASTAETQGGYAYSGLLTPDGSNSTSWAQSEMLPVSQGEWYTAEGWLYSPPGYSGVSLSVMWWDHAGNFISSSNASITLAAATWTQVTNIFQAPTGAAQAALAPSEGGTPTAADLLYISAVTLTAAGPTTLASVAEIAYSGVWPLTGITQLA